MEKIIQIPSKTHKNWEALIKGNLDISFNNFFFQKKVTQLIDLNHREIISLDKAIDELYTLCNKFCNAAGMYDDLIQIFDKKTIKVAEVEPTNSNSSNKKKAITKFELKNIIAQKEAELQDSKKQVLTLKEENALLLKKYKALQKGLKELESLKTRGKNTSKQKVKPFLFF